MSTLDLFERVPAAAEVVPAVVPGELLTLRHDALSSEAYGPGIRAGLRFVARVEGFPTGIGHAFLDEAAR